MPAERSVKRNLKAGSAASRQLSVQVQVEPLACHICGQVIRRTGDMKRHMKTHSWSAKRLPCPWIGCGFSALQQSNLDTHYRRHTGEKSYVCRDSIYCRFRTVEHGSLIRHRKALHGYIPKKQEKKGGKIFLAPTSDLPSSSIFKTSSSPDTSSLNHDSSNSPSLDLDMSTLSDKLNFLLFCADMENLDSWGAQIPY